MKLLDQIELKEWYPKIRLNELQGRWVTLDNILPLIKNLDPIFEIDKIGQSSKGKDIFSIAFGNGDKSILIWTQMHGNESTGTKAVFDLMNFFKIYNSESSIISNNILKNCKIVIVPMLNPDGAKKYTRVNANDIDLNRDVIDKNAVESHILWDILDKVKPDYCFNMHDQRTIFSIGNENNPATLSFLAPSIDESRRITDGRKKTMKVIVEMNNLLQKFIPNQIGRYSDEFYPTATGDNFQKMGYNTILIESGHYLNDYQREITRELTFYALLQGVQAVAFPKDNIDYKSYFDIPDNEKKYLDIIIKGVKFKGKHVDIGIIYKEKLVKNRLMFIPTIDKIEDLSNYNANKIVQQSDLAFSNKDDMKEWVRNEFN